MVRPLAVACRASRGARRDPLPLGYQTGPYARNSAGTLSYVGTDLGVGVPPLHGATHTVQLATNVGSSCLLIRTKNTKEVHAVIPTTHPKIQSAAILIVTASH